MNQVTIGNYLAQRLAGVGSATTKQNRTRIWRIFELQLRVAANLSR